MTTNTTNTTITTSQLQPPPSRTILNGCHFDSWFVKMLYFTSPFRGLVILCSIKVTPECPVTPEHTCDLFHMLFSSTLILYCLHWTMQSIFGRILTQKACFMKDMTQFKRILTFFYLVNCNSIDRLIGRGILSSLKFIFGQFDPTMVTVGYKVKYP